VALLLVGLVVESAIGIARVGGIGRLVGTLGSPNVAGSFFASLLAPALSVFATPLGAAYRRLALTALVLGLFALFETFSRGAWSGTILSLLVLGIIALRRGWLRLTPGLLAGIAAVIVIVPFALGAVESRLATAQSPAGRITLMRLAGRMIEDHPLVGVGANNFPVAVFHYLTPEFDGTWIYSVHNKLLLVWSEAGLFAFLAFVWFLVATLRYGLRATRSSDPVLAPLAAGLVAGFAGQIVHMQVDPFRSRSEIQMLCVMCGLLAAMDRIRRQGEA
jgi:O-antigen ligase